LTFRTVLYSALAIIFVAHYFFYRSLVRFFGIEQVTYRRALLAVLCLLAVSYLPAHWLTHHFENAFTRAFSFAAGLWLGVFLHLFIASVIGRFVLFVSERAGTPLDPARVGAVFLSVAVLFSAYGVWNAFNPRIRDVNVNIAGLPAKFDGMKVVQISDVHLGQVHGAGFMQKVVDLVNEEQPDAVFITGDLFDGSDGELYGLARPIKDINAPMGVYFVDGNHDRHAGGKLLESILGRLGVRALNDEAVDLGGLQVVGVSYRWGHSGFSPAKVLAGIILYHSPVGANALAENADAGIDLQLSGHTHHGQLFPFGYITSYVFDGYDYGLYKIGKMSLYVTDGTGTWGPPMRTGTPPEIVRITLHKI